MLTADEAHDCVNHFTDYITRVRDVEQGARHRARQLDKMMRTRPIYSTTNHNVIRPVYQRLSAASVLVYGAMVEEVCA